ncbi:MAG: multidrug effflux MFS transporter [Chloroflexi bacterium]|nr:multidrug effflux MFS transporter [Chloroflexota bacterium]MDE2936872.1 multidrug effflux MFS transporter [Chloroflexota bacterium]MXW27525.1 multidrug effflux MFS transporter [Chloroflexota bacterium]MXX99350.1 multidrug effflux MFS transporter [Chloroflexota bacterium]MYB15941.1 multidrug effflux MFS transporter [Chloroflexota bacterium]
MPPPANAAAAAPPDAKHDARAESRLTTAILIALSALAPLSIDMFLPSIPDITAEFKADSATIRLAVTMYLLMSATSAMLFGPASDRFGRRPALVVGMSLYVLGGVLAWFSASAEMLVAGRIVQGFGSGAGMSIARATVIDVYGRERATRIIALMSVVMALAPMLAPIVGGIYQETVGWRWVFATLTLMGIVLIAAYIRQIPETNLQRDPRALYVPQILRNYRTLFSTRAYVVPVALVAIVFAGHLTFISTSALVLIDDIGISPGMYGLAFGIVSAGLMAGGAISGALVGRVSGPVLLFGGMILTAVGGSTMYLLALLVREPGSALVGAALIVVPMFFTTMGASVARPVITVAALTPFRHMAGLAAAVMGFSQMLVSSLYAIVFAALFAPTVLTMTGAIAFTGIVVLTLATVAGRGITR